MNCTLSVSFFFLQINEKIECWQEQLYNRTEIVSSTTRGGNTKSHRGIEGDVKQV